MTDEQWLHQCLLLAKLAESEGEVPVGALIVLEGQIIGTGYNRPISTHDPSAHAEMVAIRTAAAYMKNYRLPGAVLYCSLEPCAMCAGAIIHARLAKVVFSALDPKAGAVCSVLHLLDQPSLNHRVPVEHGLLAAESGQLLTQFFKKRRGL
jgi:tRNA(adenine34) deaminase